MLSAWLLSLLCLVAIFLYFLMRLTSSWGSSNRVILPAILQALCGKTTAQLPRELAKVETVPMPDGTSEYLVITSFPPRSPRPLFTFSIMQILERIKG